MRLIAKKDSQGRTVGFEAIDENGNVIGGAVTPAARDAGVTPALPGAPLPSTAGDYRSSAERRADASAAAESSGGDSEEAGGYVVPASVLNGQPAPQTQRVAQAGPGGSQTGTEGFEGERPDNSGVGNIMGPALTQNSVYNANAVTDATLAANRRRGGVRGAFAGFAQFGRNVGRGIIDAAEDITDFGAAVVDTVRGVEVNNEDNIFNPSARVTDPTSAGGNIVKELVSFGVSAVAIGATGGALGVARIPVIARLGQAGFAGRATLAAGQGAVTDFIKAKPGEENLYNAVKGTPLETPISRFFAADTDEDANLWLEKTKAAAGGIPLGIAFDLFGAGVGKAANRFATEPLEKQMVGLKKAKALPEEQQEAALRALDAEVNESIKESQEALVAAVELDVDQWTTEARKYLQDPKLKPPEGTTRIELLEENLVQLEEYRTVLYNANDLVSVSERQLIDEVDETIFQLEDEVTSLTKPPEAVKDVDDEFGGFTYKPPHYEDTLETVDLDTVYADYVKNGNTDSLIPGRRENIEKVLDELTETKEPLTAPLLTFSDKKGYDIRDGRSRITALKERGVKKIQAVVDRTDAATPKTEDDLIFDKILEAGVDTKNPDYFPIYKVREKYPELPEAVVNAMLYRAEKAGKIQLSALHDQGNYTLEQINAGIYNDKGDVRMGRPLFFVEVLERPKTPSEVVAAPVEPSTPPAENLLELNAPPDPGSPRPTSTVLNAPEGSSEATAAAELSGTTTLSSRVSEAPDRTSEEFVDFGPDSATAARNAEVDSRQAQTNAVVSQVDQALQDEFGVTRKPLAQSVAELQPVYRTKTEIRRAVATKAVQRRIQEANPDRPGLFTPASTAPTALPTGRQEGPIQPAQVPRVAQQNVPARAKRVARDMGIDVAKLRDTFMGKQSAADVGRFVNIDKLTDSDDVKDLVLSVMSAVPSGDLVDDLTDAALQRQAANLSKAVLLSNPEDGDALLLAYARNPANLAPANLGVRMLVNDMGQQVLEASRNLPNPNSIGEWTINEMVKQEDYMSKLARFEHFITFNKNLGKLTAQGLRSRGLKLDDASVAKRIAQADYDELFVRAKAVTLGPSKFQSDLSNLLATPAGRKKFEKIQTDLANAKDLDEALRAVEVGKFVAFTNTASKLGKLVQGVRINGILSGTGTNLTNVVSNGAMAIYAPVTQIAGAVLDMPLQRLKGNRSALAADKAAFTEAVVQLSSLTQYLGDSAKMARVAFRTGKGVLTGDQMTREIAEDSLDMLNPQTGNAMFDMTLQSLSVPTRLLLTGDEFFKQLNYRAHLRGKSWQLGIEQGLTGKKLTEYANRMVEGSFVPNETTGLAGLALNKNSREYAEFVTFQQRITSDNSQLRRGAVEIVEKLRRSPIPGVPLMSSLFVPFIKTPANILAYTARNTPLGFLSKQYRADFMAGGATAARAKGELALGTTALAGILSLAMQDRLTGRAPADPAERELWYAQGNQPYSVRVSGNKWVSFQRMEPFAGHFSLVADIYSAVARAAVTDKDEIENNMGYITGAFVTAVKNRTFFEGLSQLTEVIEAFGSADARDKTTITKATENIVTSLLPYGSLMNEQRRARDMTLREAEGYLEKFMNRLPGLSKELPAQRDWLTGKPVMYGSNPVLNLYPSVAQKNDPLIKKLLKYNTPINPPDQKIKGGVELSNQQYSKLLELTGQISIGGKTQYQALSEVFDSFDTSVLDAELDYIQANDDYARQTPLYVELSAVRSRYAKAAESALVQMYPDLVEQVRTKLTESGNVKEGMFWMNNPLFSDLGYEVTEDPVLAERVAEVNQRTNKGLEELIEGPGAASVAP